MANPKTPYILISGFNIYDNNRGTAALSYGAISFLKSRGYIDERFEIITLRPYKRFTKSKYRKDEIEYIDIEGTKWKHRTKNIFWYSWLILVKWGISLPIIGLSKTLKQIRYVAAINGGDGFSDIYSTNTFLQRLYDIRIAISHHIPVILLPQTIGPFQHPKNKIIADKILIYAQSIYIRDDKYIKELDKLGVSYEITNDLSYYMSPQPFNINIKPHAIGINISGLAYSNRFRTLSGQFDNYKYLINRIIQEFQKINIPIYLIPHSYNYFKYEKDNDDLEAIRDTYNSLKDKNNVIMVDMNLISPKQKYIISQMNYFIGTRMHANFAAIFTKVPVFGLAYSYKFEGAFNKNGIYGQTAMINNISKEEANIIVSNIISNYKSIVKQ